MVEGEGKIDKARYRLAFAGRMTRRGESGREAIVLSYGYRAQKIHQNIEDEVPR